MRDIFAVLQEIEPDLSKSEQALAALLTSNTDFAVNASITEMAEKTGISPPTVTRFCRRLGCQNFADFKVQLASAAFAGHRYIQADSWSLDPVDVADSLLAKAHGAMHDVRQSLDLALVDQAAAKIASAKMVVSFGSGGGSSMVAAELQSRLFRLGLRITSSSDHAMQLMQAAVLTKGDVLIAASQSGRNAELVRAMEAARNYGAFVIALTRADRPVGNAADLVINIDLEEGVNILRPTSTRFAYLLVIDILATRVAMLREVGSREVLRRIKHQLVNARDADDREALGD